MGPLEGWEDGCEDGQMGGCLDRQQLGVSQTETEQGNGWVGGLCGLWMGAGGDQPLLGSLLGSPSRGEKSHVPREPRQVTSWRDSW